MPGCMLCEQGLTLEGGGHICMLVHEYVFVPCSKFLAVEFHNRDPSHNDGAHDPGPG